jgi:HEAT repeat protein
MNPALSSSRRRIIFLASLLLAMLGAAVWLMATWPHEPSYNGKPLTYWLEHYWPPPPHGGGIIVADPQSVEAIRNIGTNGILTLLRLIRADDSPLKLKLIALAQKQHLVTIEFSGGGLMHAVPLQPATPQKKQPRIKITPAVVRNQWAAFGFGELRSAASNAVPSLTELLEDHPSPISQVSAIQSLGAIGPAAGPAAPSIVRVLAGTNAVDRVGCVVALGQIHAHADLAVPALTDLLSDRSLAQAAAEALAQFGPEAGPAIPALIAILEGNHANSSRAATALGRIGPVAKQAVPLLLQGAAKTNRDLEFRFQCIMALGRIHQEPELVLPLLTNCITETRHDPDVRIRMFCAEALGEYGTNAAPAVAILTELLADPNPNVHRAATNALERITPVRIDK